MKKNGLLLPLLLLLAALCGCASGWGAPEYTEKPVIYLYPEEETEVRVQLDYDGKLTCTYPESDGSWRVTAQPDGTLTDETGRQYNYLFWEGIADSEWDLSQGYVVPGGETCSFLEDTLKTLGLTDREAGDFISYWLPRMQDNAYNLITFQQKAYTDGARLTIDPQPNTILRVYMVFKPLEHPIAVDTPELPETVREGFTVVEWGGTELPG